MKVLRIIMAEFLLDIKGYIRHRFAFVSDIGIYFLLQMFFLISNTGQSLGTEYGRGADGAGLMLLGYFTWILVSACVSNIGQEMYGEMVSGTFYQKMNSILPLPILYLGKLLSSVIVQSAVSLLLGMIAVAFWHVHIYMNLYIIATILICLLGMYGIGLLIGGFFVYFKIVGGITMIIQVFLLFASNILSNDAGIGKYFFFLPLTACVDLIRKSASALPIDRIEYLLFVLCSMAFFVIGYISIHLFIKKAKKDGVLLLT